MTALLTQNPCSEASHSSAAERAAGSSRPRRERARPAGPCLSGRVRPGARACAHSSRRRSACVAARSRPVRPSSPNAASPSLTAAPFAAEAIASATARSAPGSSMRTPPATLTKTSAEPSREPRVPAEDGDDHRQALGVDPGRDTARHGEVGRRDERLDLEQDRPRSLEGAGDGGADLPRLAAAEELGGVGHADEARRRSSRRRRARWSSRSGSSRPEGCDGRGSGRPRTGARSRRGARARAGRRPCRPSSRGRPGRSRRRSPWRPAGAARRPRAPARPIPAPSRARPRTASAPSRSRRRRAARARGSRRPSRARSRPGSRRRSQPPRRSPRSFTWATDSSPVTSSARRSFEIARSAISSSVDLPTPGSPPTSTSDAGTSPPPSTRSSSGTPVGMRSTSSLSTSTRRKSGFAAAAGTPATANFDSSTSVPNSPQPGQRPSHFGEEYPQSGHEKTVAAAFATGEPV